MHVRLNIALLNVFSIQGKKKKERASHQHEDDVVDDNLDDFEILRNKIKAKKKATGACKTTPACAEDNAGCALMGSTVATKGFLERQ